MAHLKRLAAPKCWPLPRKKTKWITRPSSGPHPLNKSLPLNVLLRDVLRYTKTMKEVKKILNESKILVDGEVRKDIHFPVGFMDVVEVPDTKEYYRMTYDMKGYLRPIKIDKKDAEVKLLKVLGKSVLKEKKIQLNLSDSRNILADKDSFKTRDVIVYEIKEKKIRETLKFEKGAVVLITDGKYMGSVGIIKEILATGNEQRDKIVFTKGNKDYETLSDFAYVIGKDKPFVKVAEE